MSATGTAVAPIIASDLRDWLYRTGTLTLEPSEEPERQAITDPREVCWYEHDKYWCPPHRKKGKSKSRNGHNEEVSASAPEGMERLATTEEAAAFLNVSVTTMYRYVKNRDLPCAKLAGPLRFEKEDLRQFISRRTVKAR